MSCDICANNFTMEKRKQVECPGCELNACRECVRRYLTGEDMLQDPHCMGCRIGEGEVEDTANAGVCCCA